MPIRILLVEDQEATRFAVHKYFAHIGCHVDSAGDFHQAIALLNGLTYDAVVTDLAGTDDAEGLEVVRCARERSTTTRIVLIAARAFPVIEIEARRLGADAVIRKPVALPDLAQAVYSLLGISGSARVSKEG
jgi:DNA-binding response OmpR family regulator